MHIPSSDTVEIEVLTFENALVSTSDDYDKNRWLYVPDFYSEYRYILGTRGEKPLICIGINPSTAAPDDLDNTLKSVERIALHNGYDSFISSTSTPSARPIPTTWSANATRSCTRRT